MDSTTGCADGLPQGLTRAAARRLTLRRPDLLAGPGAAVRGDAVEVLSTLGSFDFAYLDPPYNQHRYEANCRVWETLVAWDTPEHFGVACKHAELADRSRTSAFNRHGLHARHATAPASRALAPRLMVVSHNDESWISREELVDMCRHHQDR